MTKGASPRVRGLVRVSPQVAAEMRRGSGKGASGHFVYIEPFRRDTVASVAPFATRSRAWTISRRTVRRVWTTQHEPRGELDPRGSWTAIRGEPVTAMWFLSEVPRSWNGGHIEDVVSAAGYKDVDVLERPRALRGGTSWKLRATSTKDTDLLEIGVGESALRLAKATPSYRTQSTKAIRAIGVAARSSRARRGRLGRRRWR